MTFFPHRTARAVAPLLLVALLLALPAAFLGGCSGDSDARGASVRDLQLVRDNGEQIIRGSLLNTADRTIRGARVFVDLYDGSLADGTPPADSASFEVRDIEPGESKVFRHVIDTGRHLTGARVSRVVLF
jgi:hypothetical protein